MQKTRQFKTHLYKRCPRCQGDLFADVESLAEAASAADVSYVCLQCGRSTPLRALVATVRTLPQPEEALRAIA